MAEIHDVEKVVSVAHLERTVSDESVASSTDATLETFSAEETKKLMWRIDTRLVLTLGFMYMVSLMDRLVSSTCIQEIFKLISRSEPT